MRPNEFGTLSSVVLLPDDAPFGQYTVSIVPLDQTAYITGGSTEFQVEHLSVPTFTPQVTLRSPDIEDGSIRNLRKKKNTRADSPWYSDIYE